MNALYPPSSTSPWRLVVTDRFYTSVKLALELLHRRMYLTGTIQTDRSGYATGVVTKKEYKTVRKQKIAVPPQGTLKIAQNKRFPEITDAMWMNRTPVYLLSSGGSRCIGSVSKYIVLRWEEILLTLVSNICFSASRTWRAETDSRTGVGPRLPSLDGRCRRARPNPDAEV